ncbi:MAG: LysM domain-containing protein [Candidatus Pacearchaeota archaeon]|nr:LysM domain-containing protein [Candidatus Pacearchaeota archaeon]
MENSYIRKGIALAVLAGGLSFGCYHKPKESNYNIKTDTEQVQKKEDSTLENKTYDSTAYHIIQKGDTYWSLAEKYFGTGKKEVRIEKLNPRINSDSLKVGQKIRIK